MNKDNPYLSGLEKCPANYSPLTPLSFLRRAAKVYPQHIAVIDGDVEKTWSQIYSRCTRLASALHGLGIGKNQTVAVLAPNSLVSYETHFGVPMAGAVLNAINTRLDAKTVGFILDHGHADVLIVDYEFVELAKEALEQCDRSVTVVEVEGKGSSKSQTGPSYEEFINGGDPDFGWIWPDDEWDAISLNYTSGTTGNPKGVVYHHRGAFLNALSNIVGWDMAHHPTYLWTLPMFHCNGWCFPWSLAAVGGTSVCLRRVNSANIFNAIADHGVTHFCGAPIVMGMVINATEEEKRPFEHQVNMMTAAAPPPAAVLAAMEAEGFNVTHVYGLTETYGPAVICSWKKEWDKLDIQGKSGKKSRQGVPYHVLDDLEIINPETMLPVKKNGEELGEAMFQGNIVMKGYLDNPSATADAFKGNWFHSGDLGVMHEDAYIQLKDRSKDIIISGGENISSIEIENCLYSHPAILEAAVVAKSDDKWGETPCAFVQVRPGMSLTDQEVLHYCRENLASYKIPGYVVFQELPKTSTGKVQKFKLREIANSV